MRLLNCLCAAIPARERVITCEEVFELRVPLPDVVSMQTRQPNLEGAGEIPLRRLVKEALRMRPSRIVVGEVRQEECLDLPYVQVRRLAARRKADLREVWPEVVDNLASAVRAGLSLPEALSALSTRGPEVLRPPFVRFAAEYRSSGRFGACLDRLKDDLADPVGDRIVESLRVAREVGGTDLGRVLRTLAAFLR